MANIQWLSDKPADSVKPNDTVKPELSALEATANLTHWLISNFQKYGDPVNWPWWDTIPMWQRGFLLSVHASWLPRSADGARLDVAALHSWVQAHINGMAKEWKAAGSPDDWLSPIVLTDEVRYAFQVAGDPKDWDPFASLSPEVQQMLTRTYASWRSMQRAA